MKRNKIIAGMTLTGVLLSISSTGVFADQSEQKISDKRQMMEKNSMMKVGNNERFKRESGEGKKIGRNLNNRDLNGVDEENKQEVSDLMTQYHENIQELMDEYKSDFDEIKVTYKESFEELQEEMEEDDDNQEEIREEISTLKDEFETALELIKSELDTKKTEIYTQYKSDLIEILGEDSTLVKNLEKAEEKKQMMEEALEEKRSQMENKREEMKEKMSEAKEKRKEFRKNSEQKISKYKNAYADKIEDQLAKVSQDKLQKFNEQLEELFAKVDTSETMSDDNKEMMLSRITALQDLIVEALDESDLDLNELLEMQL